MKIMMVCDYPMTPSDINGGVAAAAYNLVQALLANTDATVVTFGFWPDFSGSEPETTVDGRLTVVRCPRPQRFGYAMDFRAQRRWFRQLLAAEKPDIIHAQSEGLYASLAVNSGLPNVYTIHGIRLKELKMERARIGWLRYLIRSRLIKQHHALARYIIAINEYTRTQIGELHAAKVRVIHNAVDESFFDLYESEAAEPGRLLLVGGVRPRKDIATALKALSALLERNVTSKLDIVGPTDDEYRPSIQSLLDDPKLAEHVTLHGLVSADELDDLYRRCDLLLLSSVEESSPIAIVQAMAAGKPVVSTDVGGISEMIEAGQNGLLSAPQDAEALADNLEKVICDRDLRAAYAASSRKIAERDWSTASVANKTYDLYKEILHEW